MLFTDGVHCSDVTVLLCTKGVLTRPWCLLEILESSRSGVPVLPIVVNGNCFEVDEMHRYISNLEAEIEPKALELLQAHSQDEDLSDIKQAVHAVLEQLLPDMSPPPLQWNSHASDHAMRANLQDVVERMNQGSNTGTLHHPLLDTGSLCDQGDVQV